MKSLCFISGLALLIIGGYFLFTAKTPEHYTVFNTQEFRITKKSRDIEFWISPGQEVIARHRGSRAQPFILKVGEEEVIAQPDKTGFVAILSPNISTLSRVALRYHPETTAKYLDIRISSRRWNEARWSDKRVGAGVLALLLMIGCFWLIPYAPQPEFTGVQTAGILLICIGIAGIVLTSLADKFLDIPDVGAWRARTVPTPLAGNQINPTVSPSASPTPTPIIFTTPTPSASLAGTASRGAMNGLSLLTFLGLTSSSIRIFESGNGVPPFNQRSYNTRFARSSTRYINWELYLRHPPRKERTERLDFTVEAYWYNPEGQILGHQSVPTFVEPSWLDSHRASGWGYNFPGQWKLGVHRVDLYISGEKIESGFFEIN